MDDERQPEEADRIVQPGDTRPICAEPDGIQELLLELVNLTREMEDRLDRIISRTGRVKRNVACNEASNLPQDENDGNRFGDSIDAVGFANLGSRDCK